MALPNFPNPTSVGQQFTVGNTTYECTVLPSGPSKAIWKVANQADKGLRADLASVISNVLVSGVKAKDLVRKYLDYVSVVDFGAVNDISVDSTAAFEAAFASLAPTGGTLYVPEGIYKVTRTLYVPTGVSIVGDGYFSGGRVVEGKTIYAASTIFCEHTGPAMMSLKGSNGCVLHNFGLVGSQTAKPKTGLCLGRSSAASAGHHDISCLSIVGWFTTAAIYSIASEENVLSKIFAWNFGGDALYGIVSSTQDIFGIDGLVTSTNIANTYRGVICYVTSGLATSAGIFLQTALEMGSIKFDSCYIIQYAGAYVRINSGFLDGKAAFGPITFDGTSGEPLAGGNPVVGIDLVSSVPCNLAGLTITGARFQMFAGADKFDIRQDLNTTLLNPNIVIQPPEAFPYATSQVYRRRIKGGIVSVGREYEWTTLTLGSGWSNELGEPYPPASIRVFPDGEVALRGKVTGGTGNIFTIPDTMRPVIEQMFTCTSSGGVSRLLLNSAGVLSLQSGSAVGIDLSCIRFTP